MASFKDYLRESVELGGGLGRARVNTKAVDPRSGDNSLNDPSEQLEEVVQNSLLDRLQRMFANAGVSDDEIKAGVELSPTGTQKAAARLGISPTEVTMLIASLMSRMQKESERLDDSYFRMSESERFSCERDYLNNVTVRDAVSGKEAYLQGSEAAKLLAQLKSNPASEQQVLGGLEHLMEDFGFNSEINDGSGSYNMQWKHDGQTGFATVLFSKNNGKPHLELGSVRDSSGEDVDVDGEMHQSLLKQAQDVIGEV